MIEFAILASAASCIFMERAQPPFPDTPQESSEFYLLRKRVLQVAPVPLWMAGKAPSKSFLELVTNLSDLVGR